ncbi:MAG: hypothetical protein K2H60_15530, partial [Muribaculaceae bacterium]|nr:hypothetical protein [Muribaculaceae bacterium]
AKIVDENYPNDTIIIRGNSFGPFNPNAYFESPVKILWLLKEPLIYKESWEKGDRGGHDQAKENYLWDKIENNDTLKNLIEITRAILSNISGREYSQQETMNLLCILEVNHFPGLYFNNWESNEKSLLKWAVLNQKFISTLFNFYDPAIIFFASTLELFDKKINEFKDIQDRYNSSSLKIFNDEIKEWAYVFAEHNQEKDVLIKQKSVTDKSKINNVGRNIKYLGKSDKIYIQAYHPVAPNNAYNNSQKKDLLIGIDSNRIKEWRSKKLDL